MEKKEQIESFERGLRKLCDNYAREMDLTYAEMIGVIEIQKAKLIESMKEPRDEE